MLSRMEAPTDLERHDAPTTATDAGSRKCRTAAAAVRAPPHSARASSESSVGSSTARPSCVRVTSAGKPDSRNTASILWFSGSTSAMKREMPWSRPVGQVRHQDRAEAAAAQRSATSKAISARSASIAS